MTQYQAVLNHLREYGKITSMEAFSDYGVTRLSAIIFDLRQTFTIKTTHKTAKNRFGNFVTYAEYSLEE